MNDYLIGIDLGAGFGAKIGLFSKNLNQISNAALPIVGIGSCDELAEKLYTRIKEIVSDDEIASVGLVSPGLFAKDGTYLTASNIKILNGKNLRLSLEEIMKKPVGIENDANAGGLAEWSDVKKELMYWVLGGGLGGAWISAEGEVLHPAVDWDLDDSSLHLTNEPGYATPLLKTEIKEIFEYYGAEYSIFEKEMGDVKGPCGRDDCYRAEVLVSGPGISRIHLAVSGNYVEPRIVDELAEKRDAKALSTYAIFGSCLAAAGEKIIMSANNNIPIYVGGGPSRALPYFDWISNMKLKKYGTNLYLSEISKKGGNANLIGAAVLANKIKNE